MLSFLMLAEIGASHQQVGDPERPFGPAGTAESILVAWPRLRWMREPDESLQAQAIRCHASTRSLDDRRGDFEDRAQEPLATRWKTEVCDGAVRVRRRRQS